MDGADDQDDAGTRLAGRLLVATPGVLEDANFRRTVVLLLEHSANGALGVIVNRPTDIPVAEPFPGWESATSPPPVLFHGGPVQAGMIIALGRTRPGSDPDEGFQAVSGTRGRIGTVDLRLPAWDLAPAFDAVRVFAGYSGWSPGQLENELRLGAWIVVDSLPGDAFEPDPDHLWSAVLRRQGGHLAMFAHYPVDVMAN